MTHRLLIKTTVLLTLLSSSTALSVGGYSQVLIAHNLTGSDLTLDCKGGDVFRERYTQIKDGKAKLTLGTRLEQYRQQLLGGEYVCSFITDQQKGTIEFELQHGQTINVWTIRKQDLNAGRFSCTSERFGNFRRPAVIIKAAEKGAVHTGPTCR